MGYETHLGFKLGVLPGYAKAVDLKQVGHDFRMHRVENVVRHRKLIENAEANGDPTRTITLRRRYGQKISRRLRIVKGYIREAVVEKDVLGLRQNAPEPFNQVQRTSFRNSLQENQELPSSEEIRRMFPALNLDKFEFARDPNKNALFMEWLDDVQGRIVRTKRENLDRGQVRVLRGPTGITDDERWSDVWVRRSYRKGLKGADQSIRAGGARLPVTDDFQSVMRLPVHAQTLAQLYTRNFQELRNLTQFIDREISRVLADGLAEGIGPEAMARRMNSVVGGVPVEPEGVSRVAKGGIHRARVIARTETIRTYNEAKLNRFQQFGIDEVQGRAEWQTAGDPRVCPRCEGMEGVVFTVKGARNLIPLHPQCRCTWVPVLSERAERIIADVRDAA